MMASATFAVCGYPVRRYSRTRGLSAAGLVNACSVLKCATRAGAGLTIGAMRVLKTSIPERGSRSGVYACSLNVRRVRRSFDHGKVM